MTKVIRLCADDFGYNSYVSQGILDLINKQRLSATSCMTTMPNWNEYLPELIKFHSTIEIGLHLNLTEGSGAVRYPLNQLIMACYRNKINSSLIEKELQHQIDEFTQHCGFLPDYIDGHQHIQQLPIIRDALIKIIGHNYKDKMPYIRISSNGLLSNAKTSFKALLVHLFGAHALRRLTVQYSIPTNSSFAGFSNFKNDHLYPKQFEDYLKVVDHNSIVMCHPGLANLDGTDTIAASRQKEYNFFNSDAFTALLNKYQIMLHSKNYL